MPLGDNVLIAFGSNENSRWGDARETVITALGRVVALTNSTIRCSALYRTPAFPAGSGPDFVNAAAQITTTLAPEELLSQLHAIEAEAGRVRTTRWGQRTLDLDLIAAGGRIVPDQKTYDAWRNLSLDAQTRSAPQELILPHPRVQDRAFVLVPLCDIAPDWRHPVLGKTAQALCADLSPEERAEVVEIGSVDF